MKGGTQSSRKKEALRSCTEQKTFHLGRRQQEQEVVLGKGTGWLVQRYFPQGMCVCVCVYARTCMRAKLHPILCNPMDCSPPGSSVHGIQH